MCTAVLSFEPGQPVLLAGVRDELIDRAWEPPGWRWPQYQGLIGGRDLLAGGTWLAVSPAGPRVACVLNGIGRPAAQATRRSRGELPLLAAAGEPLDRGALADLDPFRLLVASPEHAAIRSWDGRHLTERELPSGLHFVVNSGLADDLAGAIPAEAKRTEADPAEAGADPAGAGPAGAGPASAGPASAGPASAGPASAGLQGANRVEAPNGREHELARISHFLGRFRSAHRPCPQPGQRVADAWGSWFPLVNGDGIGPDDQRALILRRDLGGGRMWGTTSVSLVALAPGSLRYDFTAHPGDPDAWYPVL